MPILLPQNHITMTSGTDINEICKPLLPLGITFFHYVRNYQDRSQINLSTNPDWVKHFLAQELYAFATYNNDLSDYYSGYGLWSTIVHDTISYHASQYFNADHGITLIQKGKGINEFYCFGATKNNDKIINFYLNNIDLLQRFALYFREKASKILEEAEKNHKIIIDYPYKDPTPLIVRFNKPVDSQLRKEFIHSTKINHYQLQTEEGPIVITGKEIECIMKILQGKTINTMTQQLSRSRRTIEDHMNNIMKKFNCHTQIQLKEKLLEHFDFLVS
jgi:DNA-binding CsgD family transcriptional regulator